MTEQDIMVYVRWAGTGGAGWAGWADGVRAPIALLGGRGPGWAGRAKRKQCGHVLEAVILYY